MITFAVCDDEPLMARELAGHLAGYMKEKSVTDYSVSSFSHSDFILHTSQRCFGMLPPVSLKAVNLLKKYHV